MAVVVGSSKTVAFDPQTTPVFEPVKSFNHSRSELAEWGG